MEEKELRCKNKYCRQNIGKSPVLFAILKGTIVGILEIKCHKCGVTTIFDENTCTITDKGHYEIS